MFIKTLIEERKEVETPAIADSPTKKILKDARALIADPSRWIEHAYARDANGQRVSPGSATAISFCSVGAVIRASGERSEHIVHANLPAVRHLERVLNQFYPDCAFPQFLVDFNDAHDTTHGDVLALFDLAIEAL